MEKNIVVKHIKNKKNEKCGDCYYNGNCIISSKSCIYLKKERKNKKIDIIN